MAVSLVEAIRGVAVLSRLFGTGPMVAYRASRAGLDRTAARAIILSHVNSVRRWARVELDVAPVPKRAGSGFVLVYNQTSIADDLGNLDVLWRFADYSVLASEYGRIPFFGSAARRVGIVLMKRGDRQATDETLRRLARWAAEGSVVSVAAEGRLSPGGEVGHGESPVEAGLRELREETGLELDPAELVGPVIRRTALFNFAARTVRQDEEFFLARFDGPVDRFDTSGWTPVELQFMDELRWWDLDGLEEQDETVYPFELPRLVRRLLAGWDGSVVELEESE